MFILVTGGSGSGKSEFAENIAMKLDGKMLYVACLLYTSDAADD